MTDTSRSSCWSLTINNPTSDDEEALNLARQRGWRVDGQKEVGKEGTPHYQLILHTGQVRFAAVKKLFPRAHIEPARNSAALAAYVKKDDTRAGSLPSQQEMYPSQKRFFELIWDEIYNNPECFENYGFKVETKRFYGDKGTSKRAFYTATRELIRRGYVVENLASNPMTLNSWDLFAYALLDRKIAGETMRQTDEIAQVYVPMFNSLDEYYNTHAVPSPPVQAPPPPPPPGTGPTQVPSWDEWVNSHAPSPDR